MLFKMESPNGGDGGITDAPVIAHTKPTQYTQNAIIPLKLEDSSYASLGSDNKLTFSKNCKLLVTLNSGCAYGGYAVTNTISLYKNGDVVDSCSASSTYDVVPKNVLVDAKAGDIFWIYRTSGGNGYDMCYTEFIALE